jgi:hypothetical protein
MVGSDFSSNAQTFFALRYIIDKRFRCLGKSKAKKKNVIFLTNPGRHGDEFILLNYLTCDAKIQSCTGSLPRAFNHVISYHVIVVSK